MMPDVFVHIDILTAIQVVVLGFIGGVLSGFIGSGGAFFMTPGMMNLGVPGVMAVGSNITHKFGKALIGQKAHGEMGNVDRKLGIIMLVGSFIGIRVAVWINTSLLKLEGDGHGAGGSAAADLYISLIFVIILLAVSIMILRDALRKNDKGDGGPSTKLAELFGRFKLAPMIYFPVSDVRISFWVVSGVALFTGYLAGTIGVGGFIGVPAMIYIFGIPTAVAAGTELFLAMFMGAWGALNYALEGMIDLRLVALLYLGSLIGIHIGVYGTKVAKEQLIRIVTGVIIILCVISRAIAIPVYLTELGRMHLTESTMTSLELASKIMLFVSGLTGVGIILGTVVRAHHRRGKVQAKLRKLEVNHQTLPE